MIRIIISLGISLSSLNLFAANFLPERYTELLPFVQEAPDQGDTATCLYMGSTGAVELLLNKKYNIQYPKENDIFDISEIFTINHSTRYSGSWHEMGVARFNSGWAIASKDLEFNAWTPSGENNRSVWRRPSNFYSLPRIEINEKFKTHRLFVKGRNRYSKYVLTHKDIDLVKSSLVNSNSPILINYNHNGWWHVVNIVGFDDHAKGECLHTPQNECSGKGSFYVRDSLGKKTHLRDYDWFRVNGNAAFIVEMIE